MLIIAGSGASKLGRDVAALKNSDLVEFEERKFPDGERYLDLTRNCKGEVVSIIQSTYRDPDGLLMEFVMLADAAHGAGAASITGVFPYLAYLRQDERFKQGEALSSRVFARLIDSSGTSKLFVVDPHLHRTHDLGQLFTTPAVSLSAMKDLASYASSNFSLVDPLVVAPDVEGSQWASKVASALGAESATATKVRLGDASVKMDFEGPSADGRDVLLVDDIVSTGGTLAGIATILKKTGARRVIALVTHGLFAPGAYERMIASGIDHVVTTDTVPNDSAVVSVAPLIARSLG
ncbi:MAG: ribose-phosphate diphosphokinase [Nitrososphaerales archaeon]|nr:ribose-phosphate diphosphokinase [Nitrososphaerales archaeon]